MQPSLFLSFECVWVFCFHVCLCTLELKLQMAMSYRVGARNYIWMPCALDYWYWATWRGPTWVPSPPRRLWLYILRSHEVMTGFHEPGLNIQNPHERLCKLKEVNNVFPETAEQSCASVWTRLQCEGARSHSSDNVPSFIIAPLQSGECGVLRNVIL